MYTPRHYAVTQNQYKSLTESVIIKSDQVFKRDNSSTWIDTYYMDPNWGKVTTLTQLTTDSEVNHTQVGQDIRHPTSDQPSFDPLQEPSPGEGATSQTTSGIEVQVSPDTASRLDVSNTETKVSADITLTPDIHTTSKKFSGHLVT